MHAPMQALELTNQARSMLAMQQDVQVDCNLAPDLRSFLSSDCQQCRRKAQRRCMLHHCVEDPEESQGVCQCCIPSQSYGS